MKVSLIWAMARNGVIGRDNGLPWRLPKDRAFFRSTTMGKPVVMGRRTFESLDKPLSGRTNIVLSRSQFSHLGATWAADLDSALAIAKEACLVDGVNECLVAGGSGVYALALPRADRLYVTLVDADVEGDTFFPPIELSDFRIVATEDYSEDDRHSYAFSIQTLERGN
jgi:dihydrofolate reductase